MPSTADAFCQLAEYLGKAGMLLGQPFGGITDRRGEQQFAAWRRPQPVGRRLQAALVGDLEVPDLFYGVAEELDPQRMFLDGREDIKDAAAYRDVAAVLNQVRARVTGLDKPGEHVIEVGLVARPKPDRLDIAEPGHNGLQEAADRGDDDLERARGRVGGIRVREPAEHGEPLADRVRPWREPFVRERLPCREARHRLRRQQRCQGDGQVLGLTARGGYGKDETRRRRVGCTVAGRAPLPAALPLQPRCASDAEPVGHRAVGHRAVGHRAVGQRKRGRDERPQRGWRDDVNAHLAGRLQCPARTARIFDPAAKFRVVGDDAQKSGKAHNVVQQAAQKSPVPGGTGVGLKLRACHGVPWHGRRCR